METFFYFASGVTAVAWSVWLFMIWQKRACLSDTSPIRFFVLFLPASFFLLISVSGWSSVLFLRIDIIGLVFFIILIIMIWLVQFFTLPFEPHRYKNIFIVTLIIYLACSFALVCFIYFLKLYPMVAISISAFLRSFQHIEILNFLWFVLNPETNKQDIYTIFNKLIIAACAYLPLTLIRIWYINKKFKQLKREVDLLKTEVENKKKGETGHDSEFTLV